MSKALRLPEKWFRRGLWLVAVVFASFLIGLGGLVVGDLPQVESPRTVEDFIAPEAAEPVKAEIKAADADHDKAETALENARLKYQAAQSRYRSARETFDNWVATRRATARPEQDSELLSRTQVLDAIKQEENTARASVERLQDTSLRRGSAWTWPTANGTICATGPWRPGARRCAPSSCVSFSTAWR